MAKLKKGGKKKATKKKTKTKQNKPEPEEITLRSKSSQFIFTSDLFF